MGVQINNVPSDDEDNLDPTLPGGSSPFMEEMLDELNCHCPLPAAAVIPNTPPLLLKCSLSSVRHSELTVIHEEAVETVKEQTASGSTEDQVVAPVSTVAHIA